MIELLQGDCLTILPTLPEQSVQCIVTSPPYYALRDYGLPPTLWPAVTYTPLAGLPPITIPGCAHDCQHEWGEPIRAPWANAQPGPSGREKNPAASRSRGKESGAACRLCGGWRGALGLELDPLAFVGHIVLIFRELWRVLRDDGTCWVNMGDSYSAGGKGGGGSYMKQRQDASWQKQSSLNGWRSPPEGLKEKDLLGIPWRVAYALQADGWYLRSDIIWHKPNCMPESIDDRPTKAHEYLFLLAKSDRYYCDMDAIREPQTGNAHSRGTGITPKTVEGHHEKIKANTSFHQATSAYTEVPGGRNRRTVWTVPTQAVPLAHFATFPEALVEPCILAGTSPQSCPTCGAPWVRIYELTGHVNAREAAHQPGRQRSDKTDSTGWKPTKRATDRRRPTCSCPENDGSGECTVLDPFAGTFTVGKVALRYGRNAIGIELNPDYAKLADDRTDKVQIAMEAYL